MASFRKSVESAKKELSARGFTFPVELDREGAIKDLELQWNDHLHMRDQTWKTLNNSALIFVGVVGLEIYRGTPSIVMIAAYSALILVSTLGLLVALHHRRIQQKVKFPIIVRYEIILGLTSVFEDILDKHSNRGLSTSTFIIISHAVLGSISALLLARKVCVAWNWACPGVLAN